MHRRVLALCCLALLAACPTSPECEGDSCDVQVPTCSPGTMAQSGRTECVGVGPTGCAAGFEAHPSGWGCVDVQSMAACAPGTRPVLGQTDCVATGHTVCADGFETDPSGWGCRDILPAVACTGATRAALGQRSCVPIGDCAAPFPPAGATLFVDDDFTAAQLDATHFLTIAEAVAAAPAAAAGGPTLAVHPGTYPEDLVVDRAVRIVGQCAEQVVLSAASGTEPGLKVDGAIELSMIGLTLTGHKFGARFEGGATVTLEEVLIENASASGIGGGDVGTRVTLRRSVIRGTRTLPGIASTGSGIQFGTGAALIVEDSEIADNRFTGIEILHAGTSLTLTDSVVQRTQSDDSGEWGMGVYLRVGARATLERVALVQNREVGVLCLNPGSSVELIDVVVRDTLPSSFAIGYGIYALLDATLVAQNVTLTDNYEVGLIIEDAGTGASVERLTVQGTLLGTTDGAFGVLVRRQASATLDDLALVANHSDGLALLARSSVTLTNSVVMDTVSNRGGDFGRGVSSLEGSQLTVRNTAILDNQEIGAGAADPGSTISLEDSIIQGTKPNGLGRGGRGLELSEGGSATLLRVVVADNVELGIFLVGPDVTLALDDSVVRDTATRASGGFGRGLALRAGGEVTIRGSTFLGNQEVDLLVRGSASTATVFDTALLGNTANGLGKGGYGAAVQSGATMSLSAVAIVSPQALGVAVGEAGTVLNLSGTLISGVGAVTPDSSLGHGVLALRQGRVIVRDSHVTGSQRAGVAFAAGSGVVESTLITGNAIGVHTQDGVVLRETDEVPGQLGSTEVIFTSDTLLLENDIRQSGESIALPDPLQDLTE